MQGTRSLGGGTSVESGVLMKHLTLDTPLALQTRSCLPTHHQARSPTIFTVHSVPLTCRCSPSIPPLLPAPVSLSTGSGTPTS